MMKVERAAWQEPQPPPLQSLTPIAGPFLITLLNTRVLSKVSSERVGFALVGISRFGRRFYRTEIHNGKLGKDEDAGSLERATSIKGELLMVFGSMDPHVPEAGREKI